MEEGLFGVAAVSHGSKKEHPIHKVHALEPALLEIAGLVMNSVMQHQVKPYVARLFSKRAAQRVVHQAGTAALMRLAEDDPSLEVYDS